MTGQNTDLWHRLRDALIGRIAAMLDAPRDWERGSTARDELIQFTSALLDYAKAKLALPVAEVQRIGAEIAKAYAEEQERLANAEKTREEARRLRIANDVQELTVNLRILSAVLIGEPGDEAKPPGGQIDALLIALREGTNPGSGSAIGLE